MSEDTRPKVEKTWRHCFNFGRYGTQRALVEVKETGQTERRVELTLTLDGIIEVSHAKIIQDLEQIVEWLKKLES